LTTQSPVPLPPTQQFIFDCADLASSLDSLHTRNHCSYLPDAVLSGQTQYEALLQRRQTLSPTIVEGAWVDFILDGLLMRLRFLESQIGFRA